MKITKEQLFDFNKTKYNGWGCGYGSALIRTRKNMIARTSNGKKNYLIDF